MYKLFRIDRNNPAKGCLVSRRLKISAAALVIRQISRTFAVPSAKTAGFNGKTALFDMKKDIHPEYQEVVFQDASSDFKFITRSTMKPTDTIVMEDGKTYPLVKIEVSSASHPFYTGKNVFIDTAGRVEKFMNRYKKKEQNSADKA